MTARVVRRVRTSIAERGLWETLERATRGLWRRLFQDRTVVLRYEGSSAERTNRRGVDVRRFGVDEPPSEGVVRAICAMKGAEPEAYVQGQLNAGGLMYVAFVEGEAASVLWSKSGECISRWYVALEPADRVLYSMLTCPSHRGKGLIGTLIEAAVRDALDGRGRVFTDVRVWNRSSFRAIERAGFVRTVSMRPLRGGRAES